MNDDVFSDPSGRPDDVFGSMQPGPAGPGRPLPPPQPPNPQQPTLQPSAQAPPTPSTQWQPPAVQPQAPQAPPPPPPSSRPAQPPQGPPPPPSPETWRMNPHPVEPRRQRPWGKILLGGTFLVAALAVVLVIIAPDMLPTEDRAAVAAACDGRAVAGSGSYTGGMEGLVSFAKADASSAYTFEQNSSTSLKPAATVGDVTSVLCLDAPTQTIDDVCAYGDEGDDIEDVVLLESVSVSRTARLVDPSTGQDLATHSVTNPGDECPELVFESTSEKRFWGSEPDVDSFEKWLVQQLGS